MQPLNVFPPRNNQIKKVAFYHQILQEFPSSSKIKYIFFNE